MERQVKLQAKDVRKTYGSVVALEGTSIELLEGEFLTLLGPSGSGKTLVAQTIADVFEDTFIDVTIFVLEDKYLENTND